MCVCTHTHTHSQRDRAGRHWFRMRSCFQSVKIMNMFIYVGLGTCCRCSLRASHRFKSQRRTLSWSPASDRKQSSGTGIHSERVPGWPGRSAEPAVHECSSLQMCQIRESSDDWTEGSRLYKAFWRLSLPVVKASCFLVHVCIPFTLGAPRHRQFRLEKHNNVCTC